MHRRIGPKLPTRLPDPIDSMKSAGSIPRILVTQKRPLKFAQVFIAKMPFFDADLPNFGHAFGRLEPRNYCFGKHSFVRCSRHWRRDCWAWQCLQDPKSLPRPQGVGARKGGPSCSPSNRQQFRCNPFRPLLQTGEL